MYNKDIVINMLKGKSCDTCSRYSRYASDSCYSTRRLEDIIANKYHEVNKLGLPRCPKEKICEHHTKY